MPPEGDLYGQANGEFANGDFVMAAQFYDKLLEQYPFSDFAEVARLRIAHAYYLGKEYEKAVAAFNDFERLHPTSPALPFVEYSIGMAYLDQARPLDRDKGATENAKLQFERVSTRYEGSLYGRLAVYRIGQCNELLAGHELKVGEYYATVGQARRGAGTLSVPSRAVPGDRCCRRSEAPARPRREAQQLRRATTALSSKLRRTASSAAFVTPTDLK